MDKLLICILTLGMCLLFIGTATAAADTTVTGIVLDSSNNRVDDATINIHSGVGCDGPIISPMSETTNSVGWYSIYAGDLESTDVITVCATSSSGDGETTTTAGSVWSGDYINIALANIGVSSPELPTVALPIAAVIGLLFIFSVRKKD